MNGLFENNNNKDNDDSFKDDIIENNKTKNNTNDSNLNYNKNINNLKEYYKFDKEKINEPQQQLYNNLKYDKNKNNFVFYLITISIIAISIFGFIIYFITRNSILNQYNLTSSRQINNNSTTLNLTSSPLTPDTIDPEGRLSTTAIASKVRPSVVGIVSYVRGISLEPISQGSGVIMTEDGYIITNAHVLMNSDNSKVVDGIKVVLYNEEEYTAEIVGVDVSTDLAIIKASTNDKFPQAEFGESDKLKVGETVIAIGNPTGIQLAGSVTKGIVSALNRNIQRGYSTEFIQTDAAINPGNSGGALVNTYGQIVGINSSKISSTAIEGIGFSIPISQAKPIIDDLIKYGYVTNRVKLGITFTKVDSILAKLNDIPTGIRIVEVDKNSSIYEKGIRIGDIITELDNKKIQDDNDIIDILKTKKPGDNLNISVLRITTTNQQKNFKVDINLEEDKGILNSNKD